MEFEEFNQEVFEKCHKYIHENISKDSVGFFDEYIHYFTDIKERCNEEKVILNAVVINFLSTSFYFDTPQVEVYADIRYEEAQDIDGSSFFSMPDVEVEKGEKSIFIKKRIDATGIISVMDIYKENLAQYVKECNCTKEWEQYQIRNMLGMMLLIIAYYFKYEMRDKIVNGDINLSDIKNEFGVYFGSFGAWRQLIYKKLDTIDLTNLDKSEDYRYRKYEAQNISSKKFINVDFLGATFVDCFFDKCSFDDCSFNDAIFINCKFRKTEFLNGDIYGAYFENCQFIRSSREGTKISSSEDDVDYFRSLIFKNCEEDENGLFLPTVK